MESEHGESIICKRFDAERDTYRYYKIMTPGYANKCKRKPKKIDIEILYMIRNSKESVN